MNKQEKVNIISDEWTELKNKIISHKLLVKTDNESVAQHVLLIMQLNVMENYAKILELRINEIQNLI